MVHGIPETISAGSYKNCVVQAPTVQGYTPIFASISSQPNVAASGFSYIAGIVPVSNQGVASMQVTNNTAVSQTVTFTWTIVYARS